MTPIYGEKQSGQNYVVRPGVYGIAFDTDHRVALVKVPYGYHLPGGGIELGEDHITCLEREFLEETGCAVDIGACITVSRQYAYSERSKNFYELVGHFYFATINEKKVAPIELDHELVWHTVDEAVTLLSLEYQVKAVKLAWEKIVAHPLNQSGTDGMNKGQKYDKMIANPQEDTLGFFENYFENMTFLQECIRKRLPNRIFDVGCGTGNLSGPLSETFHVVGIDQSAEMLTQAKYKFPKMEIMNASIEAWLAKWHQSKGDLIVSSFVMHAIQDKNSLQNWAINAIRNGTTIIIMDYFFDNADERLKFIDTLRAENRDDLADLIESKFYIKLDTLENWCQMQNVKCEVTMRTHWIGVVEMSSV